MSAHLSDDQLLDQLYGVASHAHAQECEECSGRYRELERMRVEMARPIEISAQHLAEQRARIVARLGERRHGGLKWIPALAAASAMVIGFFVYRPVQAPPRAEAIAADEQIYSELYSMEQSSDPRGAAPLHALFEDNQ